MENGLADRDFQGAVGDVDLDHFLGVAGDDLPGLDPLQEVDGGLGERRGAQVAGCGFDDCVPRQALDQSDPRPGRQCQGERAGGGETGQPRATDQDVKAFVHARTTSRWLRCTLAYHVFATTRVKSNNIRL